MARILKWKEKLALALVALFFSMVRVWSPQSRNASAQHQPFYSRILGGTAQGRAFGFELMARRPYVRPVRASLAPIAMPLVTGAFVAMAGAGGAAGAAGALALFHEASADPPDERVKPEESLDNHVNRRRQIVVAPHVA
jgi:hypothetical protein